MVFISERPLGKEENNFNLMRLVFSSFVIFSHSYSFLGLSEPVVFGRSLGNFAVHCFFILSGYMISGSWLNQKNTIVNYIENRFLRIVPGLVVSLFICHYVGLYFDFFKSNPLPYIVNGPIWTLTWELVCYLMIVVLGVFFVLNEKTYPSILVCSLIIYVTNYTQVSNFYLVIVPFIICFMLGSFIFIMRESINLHKTIIPLLIVLSVCFDVSNVEAFLKYISDNVLFLYGFDLAPGFIGQLVYMLALPFVLIYFGLHINLRLKVRADISYGVYIYGWPVSQIIVFYSVKNGFALNPMMLSILTLMVTMPIAYLSWKVVEAPALKLKGASFIFNRLSLKRQ
ncbi:MAG: acyltransferase family protein [Shewanella sp.]